MKYFTAIKNKILLFERKWMELEIIMLCEIRSPEKDKYYMFSLMWTLDLKRKNEWHKCKTGGLIVSENQCEGKEWKENEKGTENYWSTLYDACMNIKQWNPLKLVKGEEEDKIYVWWIWSKYIIWIYGDIIMKLFCTIYANKKKRAK
jgi:hypothetical protein